MHKDKSEKLLQSTKGADDLRDPKKTRQQNTEVAFKGQGMKKQQTRSNKVFQELPKLEQEQSHDEFAAKINMTERTRGNNLRDVQKEMPDFAKSQANVSQGAFSSVQINDDKLTETMNKKRKHSK